MANVLRKLEDTIPPDKGASEDRLVMLCDGVFAIALTLLVLDIRLPDDPGQFRANLPEFFIKIMFYLVTFLSIAGYWIRHRTLMHTVRRLDSTFIWLTFLFLAVVALFPVTITVLLEFGNFVEATLIYVVSLAACGYSASALWIYASLNHRLIDPDVDQRSIHYRTLNGLIQPSYVMLSLLLLFIPFFASSPPLIFFSWLLLGLPYNIMKRIYRHIKKSGLPPSEPSSASTQTTVSDHDTLPDAPVKPHPSLEEPEQVSHDPANLSDLSLRKEDPAEPASQDRPATGA